MTRGGAQKLREAPMRKCLVTQDSGDKAGLIRFVTGPDDIVVPDILNKLPGRGYYVSANRAILSTAVDKKIFARGAKAPVTIPPGLIDEIERQLAARVVHLIALARKAGQAITGFEKVKAWLANGHVKVLFQASDGSTRGKDKLWTPEGARYFDCLTSDELGLAFGRGHAIHGALASGGLSARVVEEASRLRGLRESTASDKGQRPVKGR